MYRYNKPKATTLKVNTSSEGESIEAKMRRVINNKEPIKDGAPKIYTKRSEGVKPEYDIRTDRFEIALEARTHIDKARLAERENKAGNLGKEAVEGMKKEGEGTAQSIPGTDQQAGDANKIV